MMSDPDNTNQGKLRAYAEAVADSKIATFNYRITNLALSGLATVLLCIVGYFSKATYEAVSAHSVELATITQNIDHQQKEIADLSSTAAHDADLRLVRRQQLQSDLSVLQVQVATNAQSVADLKVRVDNNDVKIADVWRDLASYRAAIVKTK